ARLLARVLGPLRPRVLHLVGATRGEDAGGRTAARRVDLVVDEGERNGRILEMTGEVNLHDERARVVLVADEAVGPGADRDRADPDLERDVGAVGRVYRV